MKIYIKAIIIALSILSFSAYSQDSLAVKNKCDSLKADYQAKLDEWIKVDKNIRSITISIDEYDSLTPKFSILWNEVIKTQINYVKCKYPKIEIDNNLISYIPVIPKHWTNKEQKFNLPSFETREKVCSGLYAAYLAMDITVRDISIKAMDDKIISLDENHYLNRVKYRSKQLRNEYYSAINSLNKATFTNDNKRNPDSIKSLEVIIESWSVDATAEQIDELEFLVKNALEKRYPQLPLKMGISGAINIYFTLTKENEITDFGIVDENQKDLGFVEVAFFELEKISKEKLLKSKNISNSCFAMKVFFLTPPKPSFKNNEPDLKHNTILESGPELTKQSKNKILEFLNKAYSGKGDGVSGEVIIKFVCTKEGTAHSVIINKEKPVDMGFCEAVIEAMKLAEFIPAKEKNGEAVNIRMALHFYFYNREYNRIEIK